MAFLHLTSLLHVCRLLVMLSRLGALVAALILVFKTVDVIAGKPEVRLVLNTTTPNLFPALHDFVAGFYDGAAGKSHRPERGPLPALRAGTSGFEVAADPQAPLLRYEEPSPWKRLVLLYLGASDDYLSLAWVVFFGVVSWLLHRLLQDVKPSTPFTLANAHRLRILGLWILGPIYFGQALSYLALRALIPDFYTPNLAEPLSHYVRLNTEASLPGWEIGLMLLVIAAVYQRGVELSREAELVI
ncbi:hypothetical protein BEN47_15745 [Hymenobacter lapidarius]|uniref:DUF2975 domain-containing protein n=1 Tax=Hymenobacter lapidarius TaxID=1908237 RepID=A0A1G1T1M7_9BACT|nr:DUF2975 domain-containing protein [Hymenobacter lapidarius]OGX84789.1 hypothetical protein BEN47_15745 [Hymenobacter lapidarius]